MKLSLFLRSVQVTLKKYAMKTKPHYIILAFIAIGTRLFAVEPTPHGAPPPMPSYTLVFSDDFSTDPNTNGQWTVFRKQGNLDQEGYWDPIQQVWHLTRQQMSLATAAFANYELTAKVWKVDFSYHVNNSPSGADGFVFMFYKDKSAYGTPESGQYMAFQRRNFNNPIHPFPVRGYGLEFDTYNNPDCDPLLNNYVAIIQDEVCDSALIYAPSGKIDDNVWHSVEFTFSNGRSACTIDGITVHGFRLSDPDYTYTGVGFGAGTGSFTSDQIIDNFQIWVAE
jgi:Bacterial lectin